MRQALFVNITATRSRMEKYTQAGDFPVYSYLNEHLHSFCLCMYVKAGSMYEIKEMNGITHFYEHIVIRNINSLMDGKLYETLDRKGLSFNGTTYKEFVQFYMNGAVSNFREAASIFLELLKPLSLSEKEIDTERKRVIAEIREYKHEKTAEQTLEKKVWKDTTLAYPITGKKTTLEKIGKKELKKFRKEFFSLGNVFVYLTGCISGEDELWFIDKMKSCSLEKKVEERKNLAPVPAEFYHRENKVWVVSGKETEVAIAFDIPAGKFTDAELEMFRDFLSFGDCCPVYQELSEKTGYIYSYNDQIERYKNIAVWKLSYEVSAGKLYKALKTTVDILKNAKKGKYHLDYVQALFRDNADMDLDDVGDLNWNRAYENHILEDYYPDIESKKKAYEKVKDEDMVRLAKEIFTLSNLTLVIRGDKEKIDKKKILDIFGDL